jgi:hypothetical protein
MGIFVTRMPAIRARSISAKTRDVKIPMEPRAGLIGKVIECA